jgi:ribose transport system permease protein
MIQDPAEMHAGSASLRPNASDLPARPEPRQDSGRNLRALGLLQSSGGILVATILLFLASGLLQPQSLGPSALSGMLPFAAILAIVSLGQTLVIQQGGIDLSVPGVVSLSAVIVSYYAINHQGPDGPALGTAILCAFAAALASGVINGLLVSVAGVAPIVATIGMNALLYGVNLKISGGTPVSVPEAMTGFANAKIFGVTVIAYLAILIAAALIFLIKNTVFGRRFEAAGASPRASRAAGVTSGRYQIAAYSGAALLYCTGGVLLGGIMQLPSAFQGDTYLMPSIAAVVLGGTSLFGGSGNLAAAAIAALFLTQLQQLVLTTGASIGVQYLFQGAAIIVGVGVYSINLRELKTHVLTLLGVSQRNATANPSPERRDETFRTP